MTVLQPWNLKHLHIFNCAYEITSPKPSVLMQPLFFFMVLVVAEYYLHGWST